MFKVVNSRLGKENELGWVPDIYGLIDWANLSIAGRTRNLTINLEKIPRLLTRTLGGAVKSLRIYVPSQNLTHNFQQAAVNLGYQVVPVVSKDSDAIMAMDFTELLLKMRSHMPAFQYKVLVLGTHDGDFSQVIARAKNETVGVVLLGFRTAMSTLIAKQCEIIDISCACIPMSNRNRGSRLSPNSVPGPDCDFKSAK